MHPMGGEQVGWEAVRASFEQAAGAMTDSHVELIDQRIHAFTDSIAPGPSRFCPASDSRRLPGSSAVT